jgi:hypothetical protein
MQFKNLIIIFQLILLKLLMFIKQNIKFMLFLFTKLSLFNLFLLLFQLFFSFSYKILTYKNYRFYSSSLYETVYRYIKNLLLII